MTAAFLGKKERNRAFCIWECNNSSVLGILYDTRERFVFLSDFSRFVVSPISRALVLGLITLRLSDYYYYYYYYYY